MPIFPRHDGIPQPTTDTILRDNSSHVDQEFVLDTTAQPPLKPLLLKFDNSLELHPEADILFVVLVVTHFGHPAHLLAYHPVYLPRGGVFYIYFWPSSLRA